VDYEDHYVEVFVSQSSTKGNAGKKQFLFANDRLFYDKSIHQTIVRNFEHYWGQSHSGHYVVFINVPNHLIDVNVHPHKTQIKFFKPGIITSLISSGIKANTPEKKEIYSQGIEPLITKINFENPVAPEEFKEKNITQIHMLENCCSLLKIEQKFYIVSLKKLFIQFWSNVLQDRNLPEDLQVTPLLIAWPFKEYSNLSVSSIHLLEDWGLEFDLLNDGTPLLKAIPEKLDQTTIPFFVEPLIDLSINNQELLLVNRESLQSLAVSNSQEMYLHIKENLQTLMSSDTLVSLNDKTLEQIFLENE
jgi:DNA mismatch repair protein MutL